MGNQCVVRMLFTGLVRFNEKLEPCLELAESYRVSDDFKTYTFTLKDCTWSDGSPITAYDFEQSWRVALTPAYSSSCTNLFFFLKNGRKVFLGQLSSDQLGVKALDEKTLMVELENENPYFLNILAHSIFSPVHHTMLHSLPNLANLICSGPFCLNKYAIQDQIILSKNLRYWNPSQVHLDELHFYIIKDATTALMMFEKQEIDWLGDPVSRITSEAIPDLKKQGILHSYSAAGLQWLFINTNKYPLNNINIRKALAYSIDRAIIMENLLCVDKPNPTLGLIPRVLKRERWHPWFRDNDVQQARALFEKGLQELGITKEKFPPIHITYAPTTATGAKVLEAIQQMWQTNLGINIKLEQVDGPILFSKWYGKDYQIAWLAWVLQYNDPVNMFEMFKYKNIQPNHVGWENPSFITHANASLSALTEDQKWSHVEEAEKIFFDEMPSIPVNDLSAHYVQQPYVKGVQVNPLFLVDFTHASVD